MAVAENVADSCARVTSPIPELLILRMEMGLLESSANYYITSGRPKGGRMAMIKLIQPHPTALVVNGIVGQQGALVDARCVRKDQVINLLETHGGIETF
jgi:hypothetical protein